MLLSIGLRYFAVTQSGTNPSILVTAVEDDTEVTILLPDFFVGTLTDALGNSASAGQELQVRHVTCA